MANEVAKLLDEARESLAKELHALDELSERAIAKAKGAPKYSIQLSSHVAFLAKARAEIVSHLRQLEKHDRLMATKPENRFALVREYVRSETTPEQRAELLAMLGELDAARRVLS